MFAGLRGTVGAADFLYFQSLLVLLCAVIFGVTSVTGALLGGTALMLLRSAPPDLAAVSFVILGIGAVLLARDPNGIANYLFKLGRRSSGTLLPRWEEQLRQRLDGLLKASRPEPARSVDAGAEPGGDQPVTRADTPVDQPQGVA